MEDTRKLDGEELKAISGGYIYDTGEENELSGQRWLVIDNKGNVIRACGSKVTAANYSKSQGWPGKQLTDEEWQKLKGGKK